jgi:nitrite reductase (NO-forming)
MNMAQLTPPDSTPRLSDLIEPSTRRGFLANASVLSFAIPGLGAAIAACSPGDKGKADTTSTAPAAAASGQAGAPPTLHNPDSRLDTALMKGGHPVSTAAGAAPGNVAFHRFDPTLPPLGPSNLKLHWHTKQVPIRISEDTVVAGWTFEGDTPGPIIHCKVGDTIDFTLTNDVDIPHSMDFHASQVNPKEAFRSIAKGQSVSFTFKPKYAGAFMYHCGTSPVLMHIGSGMFGAIIVSPKDPLPPAKEFVLIQNELYLADAVNGIRAYDYQKMLGTFPDLVVFNGRPNQYMKEPLKVKVGDRVRFYVVNMGPTHACNFHVVGEQFDTVYLAAPPASAIHGVQTWAVAPGGGMIFELLCDVAGEFPFVNHGFGHGQKGGIGILEVES